MSLWQFGNEYGGLLIVAADSEEAAIEQRNAWVIDQQTKADVFQAWWAKAQAPQAGLWIPKRGWIAGGHDEAERRFGPEPEYGATYIANDLPEEPICIGSTFAYVWTE